MMPRTREQIEQAGRDAEAWLDTLEPKVLAEPEADTSDLRELARLTHRLAEDSTAQTDAVRAARRNGKTWAEIAVILGVSRQAARKRFGEPVTL